ncbi:MAG TPA: hypothetical protein VGL23_15550 [Chloroflexota bacterium]
MSELERADEAPPAAPAEETPAAPEPRGGLLGFYDRHPLIVAWLVLAIGMVAILLYTSRDVGLLPSQTFAMVIATVALAGACVWIISWD